MKVFAAMSGGVDSSVAAALLKEEGYDVTGVTMRLRPGPEEKYGNNGAGEDRAPNAVEESKEIADKLDIPHMVMDFRDAFAEKIIDDFCREYSAGRTPNPCVICNKYIKFGVLMEKAREMGADYIATGHYARIERDESGSTLLLKKGADNKKEQSYFLCQLNQEQLSHTLFPVGNITKDRVRRIANEIGLSITSKAESQEICFIPDDDYPRFLNNHISEAIKPGPILDEYGNNTGEHQGLPLYTIGQRKGLGISAAEPCYVTAIETHRNALIIGTKKQTYSRELTATNLNWITGYTPKQSITVKARIRYRHPEAEAIISPLDESRVHVKFVEPQMAITPGQTVVFYDGDIVIGGGIINI